MTPSPRAARTAYRSLLRGAAPLITAGLWRRSRREGGRRFFRQRRGRDHPVRPDRPLWLHAASVGEVRTAAPLIEAILASPRRPELVLTTATATGATTTAHLFGGRLEHAYLPVDLPGPVERFLDAIRPCAAVVLETELWPNLFAAARRRDIPLVIAHGRLSRRSAEASPWVRALQAQALESVQRVLARSAGDATRFAALGVPAERIQTVGSLKWAPPAAGAEPITLGRPTVVAASTHHDEEHQLARAWARCAADDGPLLVLVPRHPHRGAGIAGELRARGWSVARRAAGEAPGEASIYVADTLGELDGFLAAADVVFVGGSLIPHGGQNVVEPARLGRAVVFGPSMENFAEESRQLLEAGGARRVADEEELAEVLAELLASPEERQALGRRAASTVRAAGNVVDDYLAALRPLWAAG